MSYQSPLRITENYPAVVVYADAKSGATVGKVYQTKGSWYVSSCYLSHWTPVEVFSKIEGFLLINNLHKQNNNVL